MANPDTNSNFDTTYSSAEVGAANSWAADVWTEALARADRELGRDARGTAAHEWEVYSYLSERASEESARARLSAVRALALREAARSAYAGYSSAYDAEHADS